MDIVNSDYLLFQNTLVSVSECGITDEFTNAQHLLNMAGGSKCLHKKSVIQLLPAAQLVANALANINSLSSSARASKMVRVRCSLICV